MHQFEHEPFFLGFNRKFIVQPVFKKLGRMSSGLHRFVADIGDDDRNLEDVLSVFKRFFMQIICD
jgi:hypothetical protein